MFSEKSKLLAILATSLAASCGGKSSSSTSPTAGTTATTRTATGAVQASSIDKLGLTGSLSIDLPTALTDSTSALRLNGTKSIEACLMRESAKQLVQQVDQATSLLCHIEAEGANIQWNTPVILDFSDMTLRNRLALQGPPSGGPPTGGPPTGGPSGDAPSGGAPSGGAPEGMSIPMLGIYADDTDGDNVSVYICQGEDEESMSLVQSFKIKGSKTITKDGKEIQVSKGEVNLSMGDDTMGTFKGAIGYDSYYTDSKTSALKLEVKFGFTGFSFAQYFDLNAKDSGLTKVAISEGGTMSAGSDSFSFKNAGLGMFDAENGNVLYSYSGNGNDFATQACVDKESNVVDCGSDAKFASGGDLAVAATDVPKVLPSTYTIAAPSGFDCSTATWTKITPATDDATMAKHEACMGDSSEGAGSMGGMSDCFSGADYQQGITNGEVTLEEGAVGDFGTAPTLK